MKKYIITSLLLLLLFNLSYSQEGIGKFKINKTTTEIIKDIENDIGVNCELTNTITFYNIVYSGKFLFEEILIPDTNVRLFYISDYNLSDINLHGLYLTFYKNYLIQIQCDNNNELNLLLTKKYGRPYIEQKIIPNINNSMLKYDESINKFEWKNGNIRFISYEKKQIFDGIVREAESYFKIYDRTYINIINKINID